MKKPMKVLKMDKFVTYDNIKELKKYIYSVVCDICEIRIDLLDMRWFYVIAKNLLIKRAYYKTNEEGLIEEIINQLGYNKKIKEAVYYKINEMYIKYLELFTEEIIEKDNETI